MTLALALAALAALQGGQTVEKKNPTFEEMVRMRVVLSVPGMDQVSVRRNVVYKTADGEPLHMDVYSPPGPPRARPTVILIHGGPIPRVGAKNMGVFLSYGELLAASFAGRPAPRPENIRVTHKGFDHRTVLAKLDQTASCYLLAFRPDGAEQLCWPASPEQAPPAAVEITYPSSGLLPLRNSGEGMYAFVLVASRRPLPARRSSPRCPASTRSPASRWSRSPTSAATT